MMKILFVDDDEKLLRSLQRQSHSYREEWEVSTATNGHEALRVASTQAIDVLVTDILMPEMDGIETIVAFRRKYPSIKIIAMSGGGQLVDKGPLRIARTLGANTILEKPFEFDELRSRIETLLESN